MKTRWTVAVAVTVAAGSPPAEALAPARTHEQVVARLGPQYRAELRAAAARVGSAYPPEEVRLVGLKEEARLEVWVKGASWQKLRSYPVLAASGGPGPKRLEGDFQVPEGLYRVAAFNPNSRYHLSLRVDYPNRDDRTAAASEGRTRLGGDIYIHGKAVSRGCLAIGDRAIEELYLLLADTGLKRASLVLAPSAVPRAAQGSPRWIGRLYERIQAELLVLHSPGPSLAGTSPAASTAATRDGRASQR